MATLLRLFLRRQSPTLTETASKSSEVCFIAIGANLGNPIAQVTRAIGDLSKLACCQLVATSALYKSPPLEYPGISNAQRQQFYVNAVVSVNTTLTAEGLLDRLQEIEAAAGRERDNQSHQWSARRLDLDILAYGQQQIDTARLTVPHPRISERSFVLMPLCDIAPALNLPNLDTPSVLLNNCALDGIEQLGSDGTIEPFAIETNQPPDQLNLDGE